MATARSKRACPTHRTLGRSSTRSMDLQAHQSARNNPKTKNAAKRDARHADKQESPSGPLLQHPAGLPIPSPERELGARVGHSSVVVPFTTDGCASPSTLNLESTHAQFTAHAKKSSGAAPSLPSDDHAPVLGACTQLLRSVPESLRLPPSQFLRGRTS